MNINLHANLEPGVLFYLVYERFKYVFYLLLATFSSPNYPDKYPNSYEDTSVISVESGNVQLQVLTFFVEEHAECNFDKVRVSLNVHVLHCGIHELHVHTVCTSIHTHVHVYMHF